MSTHPGGPLLLAFDTAGRLGSVAVGTPSRVHVERALGASARHSESLLPAIDLALRHAGVSRGALTGIIVGAGPGSFTGVRIAGATAKAIARALDVPLYAFSSLAMLAAGAAMPGRTVCALFDARRGEVYAACYRFESSGAGARMETMMTPTAAHAEEIAARLAGQAPLWVGDGALRYADRLRGAGIVAPPALAVPRASSLLWLCGQDAGAGLVQDRARWAPEYVRSPGAMPQGARIARRASPAAGVFPAGREGARGPRVGPT